MIEDVRVALFFEDSDSCLLSCFTADKGIRKSDAVHHVYTRRLVAMAFYKSEVSGKLVIYCTGREAY